MRFVPAAIVWAAAIGGLACGSSVSGPPDQSYELDGVVRVLPRRPGGELSIHHQAIPDFVASNGETVGMESMVMPFSVGDGVSLDGIEVGDSIHFRLEVRWTGHPTLLVTALEELPPGSFDPRGDHGSGSDEEGGAVRSDG